MRNNHRTEETALPGRRKQQRSAQDEQGILLPDPEAVEVACPNHTDALQGKWPIIRPKFC